MTHLGLALAAYQQKHDIENRAMAVDIGISQSTLSRIARLREDLVLAGRSNTMTHIISDPSMKRPGYIYDANGIGAHVSAQPHVVWKHIDGPLLYCSNGLLHWLTWRERLRLWLGWADIHDIDFERRTPSSVCFKRKD